VAEPYGVWGGLSESRPRRHPGPARPGILTGRLVLDRAGLDRGRELPVGGRLGHKTIGGRLGHKTSGVGFHAATATGTAGGAGLAIFTAASYRLIYLVPLFGWPEWVACLSMFDAIGNPYLEIPAAGGITFLAALAELGSLLAVGVAARSPKTA
jgi:hypothetical protein